MLDLLLIASGGALGAMTRFLALSSTTALWGNQFPYGTLLVNVAGSFLAGIVVSLMTERSVFSDHAQSLLLIGFLGSLTTFSSFSVDTIAMINNGFWLKAFGNIFLNICLCLFATFSGVLLARGN